MKKVSPPISISIQAACLTPDFTGADLANLVNEAALVATRRNADAVTIDDFTAAVERIVAGLAKRSRVLSPREREIIAHHEMGHALVAMALPRTHPYKRSRSSLGVSLRSATPFSDPLRTGF